MKYQFPMLIAVMAILLLFSSLYDSKYYKKICVIVVTITLTLFSGFRTWWFGDLIKYYTLYRNVNSPEGLSLITDEDTNIGIRVFFRTMGSLGISYDVCIFIIAAFSAITLGILIYKYSPSPYWSYMMFISMGFYMFTYSGLKQTIAMGFIVLAVICILENKIFGYLIWVAIAGLFHAPALIFLPAYIIAKRKIDLKYILILLISVILVYYFRNQIIDWITSAYYEEERLYTVTKTIGGRAVMMILIIFLAMFLRPVQDNDYVYRQIFNLMVVAAVIQYFSIYDNVFTRLADYYYQFIILFMPLLLENGYHQLKMNPKLRYKVRCYNPELYTLLGIGITLFALWFYHNSYIDSAMMREFKFFWQIDPYSLYGA